MNKRIEAAGWLLVAALLVSATALAGQKRETTMTFEKKDIIKISTISGDCVVEKGDSDEIRLEISNRYSPRGSFEPKIRETSNALKLTEKITGSNSGGASWVLTVPDGVEIRFSSASGDLSISDIEGEFSAETASGDIEVEQCTGEFDFSSASGSVDVVECRGVFELSTASGDITAMDVIVGEESSFTTASGRVEVILAESPDHDLHVGTASGRATLDYGANPLKGRFEFVAKYRSGRIDSPVEFDEEERFRRWGDSYVRKAFTVGEDTPEIRIETASGRAVLRQG